MPGPTELVVILAVALLIFGPHKMPEIGRNIGRVVRDLRRLREDFIEGISGVDDDRTYR